MRFFKKQPSSSAQRQAEGLVAYYGLAEWWHAAFTKKERDEIDSMWGWSILGEHPLTQGHVTHNPLSAPEFLLVLVKRVSNKSVSQRIYAKVRELAPGYLPGYVNNEHYYAVMERAKNLIRDGKVEEADALVDKAFTAFEAYSRIGESLTQPGTVPPANYHDFAILYRKQKNYAREVAILELYMRQPRAPGKLPGELEERLHKARELHRKANSTA